ncbi:MAG: hypothetical protein MJK04_25400 [Psychrosphaera sp.]|nr:hypothetical protein [Psychrosphaera sp.]
MKNETDTTFIPEGCPRDGPILVSSQSAAFSIAAQAQSLFQGFLHCLHKTDPNTQFNPNSKKGSSMVGYFTSKLDNALATEYDCSSKCDYVNDGGTCPHKKFKKLNRDIADQKSRYIEVKSENKKLKSQCDSLEDKVSRLLAELSKRRTQYNNRVLVEVFVKHFQQLPRTSKSNSFFDIVPREQLAVFLPFLRKIVLGPAMATKFDAELTQALTPFKDENGSIAVTLWDDVFEDYAVSHIMTWVADALFQRSLRKTAFQTLLQNKSPISAQKVPIFIALIESMETLPAEKVA